MKIRKTEFNSLAEFFDYINDSGNVGVICPNDKFKFIGDDDDFEVTKVQWLNSCDGVIEEVTIKKEEE